MNVWVLIEVDYGRVFVVGVFSTLELAKKAVPGSQEWIDCETFWYSDNGAECDYQIDVYEIDHV